MLRTQTDRHWSTLKKLCLRAKRAPLQNTRNTIKGWSIRFLSLRLTLHLLLFANLNRLTSAVVVIMNSLLFQATVLSHREASKRKRNSETPSAYSSQTGLTVIRLITIL